jgi:membrane protease YdiL (CAAX protease family)
MSPAEFITAAALVALLAVAGRYLFGYDIRLTPPNGTTPAHSPFDNGSAPFKAGPDGHPLPQWGAGDSLAVAAIVLFSVYALILLVLAAVSIVSGLIAPDYDVESLLDSPTGNSIFLAMQWCVMVGLPLLYLRARGYLFDRVTFGFRPTNIGYAIGIWLAVMFACYLVLPGIYAWLIETYETFELPDQDIVEPFGLTWGGFIITFITVVIATPVMEEFFFRGIIHQGLEKRLGFLVGAIISSAIFALFHLPFFGLMPIFFFIGFGFAIMLRATGSLWTPIAGHFVVNLIGILVAYQELF